jgi:hypothetical protein
MRKRENAKPGTEGRGDERQIRFQPDGDVLSSNLYPELYPELNLSSSRTFTPIVLSILSRAVVKSAGCVYVMGEG